MQIAEERCLKRLVSSKMWLARRLVRSHSRSTSMPGTRPGLKMKIDLGVNRISYTVLTVFESALRRPGCLLVEDSSYFLTVIGDMIGVQNGAFANEKRCLDAIRLATQPQRRPTAILIVQIPA